MKNTKNMVENPFFNRKMENYIDEDGFFKMFASIDSEVFLYESEEVYNQIKREGLEYYVIFDIKNLKLSMFLPTSSEPIQKSKKDTYPSRYSNKYSDLENVLYRFSVYEGSIRKYFNLSIVEIRNLFNMNKYAKALLSHGEDDENGENRKIKEEQILNLLNEENCEEEFSLYIKEEFPEIYIKRDAFDLFLLEDPHLKILKMKGIAASLSIKNTFSDEDMNLIKILCEYNDFDNEDSMQDLYSEIENVAIAVWDNSPERIENLINLITQNLKLFKFFLENSSGERFSEIKSELIERIFSGKITFKK